MIWSRFVLSCSWDPALLTLDLPPHKKKKKPSRSAKISSFFVLEVLKVGLALCQVILDLLT